MSVLLTGSLGLCKVEAFCHSCFADMRAGKSFNGFRSYSQKLTSSAQDQVHRCHMVVSVLEGTLRRLGKVEIQPIDTKKFPMVISLFSARLGSIHPIL